MNGAKNISIEHTPKSEVFINLFSLLSIFISLFLLLLLILLLFLFILITFFYSYYINLRRRKNYLEPISASPFVFSLLAALH